MSWLDATARWYIVLAACTWSFAPLVRWLCRSLADRGVTVARPIALLLTVFPAWLLASIGAARFGTPLILATLLAAGLIGWIICITQRRLERAWLLSMARVEVASLALFAAYLWLRGYTPQILGTEKPMDVAFLSSSMLTAQMPPPDPWFAGEPINYYFLGYLLNGTVGRLAHVPPNLGFNLALATIFSMTTVAAFGVAWNVVRPSIGPRVAAATGLVAAFLLAIAGNLYAPWRLLQDPQATIGAWWWDSEVGIGWRSSRIVCDGPRVGNLCQPPSTETINEFPFFSFLLGDLHPHLMALPYTLVAIALAWNLACRDDESVTPQNRLWLVRAALTGLLVGSLYALNAWDFPTFMLVATLGIAARWDRSPRQSATMAGLLWISAMLFWLPFFIRYVPPTAAIANLPAWLARVPVLPGLLSALAIHTGEHTSLGEYLTIFGVPYLAGLILIVAGAIRQARDGPGPNITLLLVSVATILPGVLLSAPVLPLCGIPLALAIDQLARCRTPSPRAFALTAFSCAWVLSIVVEIVYIRDVFNDRMNTLFKFYYQTWTFYAVAAAAALAVLWVASATVRWSRMALVGATALALVAGAAYPAVASYEWTERFASWRGLDGMVYGEEQDPADVAAIRWLQEHAEPGDVVLEAAGCSYRPFGRLPFNRVSAFTGLPTIIGWGDNHQRQWRAGQPDLIAKIGPRADDVATMFADPSSSLVGKYGVRWLFVGAYEAGDWRSECATAGPYPGLNAPGYPGPGWSEVFRSGETRIYERTGG